MDLGFSAERALREVSKNVPESAIVDLRVKAREHLCPSLRK